MQAIFDQPLTLGLRLARVGRRTGQTAQLLIDAARHIRARLLALPDDSATTLRRQSYAARLAADACRINGFEVQVVGERPTQPAILVANHVSWQDPILIASVVPCLAVAKHEVRDWPLVGDIACGLDFMLVDRRCPHSGAKVLLRSKLLLERGASVLTFPEGTTTRGDDILPVRRGMFGLARRTGFPIIPITLQYSGGAMAWVGDAAFVTHFLATVARPRTVARLEFGEPIHAAPGESAEALAERTRSIMRERLHRLSDP